MLLSHTMAAKKRSGIAEALALEVRKFIAFTILFNERVAAEVGLNATDMQILHLLELQAAATPGDIARWSTLTSGGATVALDRLERAGYIRRAPNPRDRRSTLIRPAPAKLRKLHAIYRSKSELLMGVLSQFGSGELRVILDFFSRINNSASPRREGS